jgi:hypothetical protein
MCANSTVSLYVPEVELLQWSNGSTDQELIVSEPDTYYALTVGPLGIPLRTDSVTIHHYAQPEFDLAITPVSCHGGSNGSFAISSTNQVAVASWLWNAADESVLSSEIAAGAYNTLVTDGHGCTWPVAITIPEPLPISI